MTESTDKGKVRDIGVIDADYRTAVEALNVAAQTSRAAQRTETDARNIVNKLQKELTERFEQMRSDAGWQTDWHTARSAEGRR